jgi:hypothetical protein
MNKALINSLLLLLISFSNASNFTFVDLSLDLNHENGPLISPGQEMIGTDGQVIDLSSPPLDFNTSNFSYTLASHELQYTANNLLCFTMENLVARLEALGPGEYKKSLKLGCNWNLLHEAVFTDNLDVAKLLITRFQFDPNAWDSQFGNCVYLVCSVSMVKLLQTHGTSFSINRECCMYSCPMDSAFKRNNFSILAAKDDFSDRLQNYLRILTIQQENKQPIVFEAAIDKMYTHFTNRITKFTVNRHPGALIRVIFKGQNGVDQGGLTKAFIIQMKNKMLEEGRVFENDSETGFLNLKVDAPLDEVKSAGFLVGLSIFHRTPIKVIFVPIIYHLMLGKQVHRDINFVSVMGDSSKLIFKSYENIRKCSDEILNSIEFPEFPGDNLRPWKKHKSVIGTREEIANYIKISSESIVYRNRAQKYEAFLNGLGNAIDYSKMGQYLTVEDLKLVIVGQTEDYTGADLRDNARLSEEINVFPDQYRWLFEIVDELTSHQRLLLLKFFTSLECLPLGGFKGFKPEDKVQIEMNLVQGGDADAHYPEAGTCTNSLKIYPYTSKEKMKDKLISAIETYGEGFYER